VTLIVGMLARKDAEAVFKDLKPLQARLIVTGFSSETAAPSERLKAAAASAGVAAEEASTLQGAVELALAPDGPAPHVVVWGSLHLVGEALSLDPATWPT
jgi:dihydrofolate synthase/folylpolyglutamate synthase